jgi:uncharacterized protein (TIGR02300 family)
MADRGTKRKCSSCGASYYDLNRTPITCPKCGAAYAPMVPVRASRKAAAAQPAPEVEPEEVHEDAELEPIGEEFEETEDLPEDEDTFVSTGDEDDDHES